MHSKHLDMTLSNLQTKCFDICPALKVTFIPSFKSKVFQAMDSESIAFICNFPLILLRRTLCDVVIRVKVASHLNFKRLLL